MALAGHYIAGEWIGDGAQADSLNPADGSLLWLNCPGRLFAEGETGGYRQSGLGRLHGPEGLNDFLETKHIYLEQGIV